MKKVRWVQASTPVQAVFSVGIEEYELVRAWLYRLLKKD